MSNTPIIFTGNPFNPFGNAWDSGNQWSSMDGQMRPLGGVGLPTSGAPWVEGTWDNSNTWSNDGQNTITNNVSVLFCISFFTLQYKMSYCSSLKKL